MVDEAGTPRQSSGFRTLSFRVEAWAAYLPGRDGMASGGAITAAAPLPASLRRRVTPIGRKALEAAWTLLSGREDEPRIILSSRHGEYSRTMGVLSSLVAEGEVSPAEFSLSVHHGLTGLLSIASGNHAGHTAVAGGDESFGYGSLEAATTLAETGGGVLLMHFDEALPPEYAPVSDGAEDGVALALLLTAGDEIRLEIEPASRPGGESLALAFATLLTSRAAEASATGSRLHWRWSRAA